MSENRRAMDSEFVQMIKDISAIKVNSENTEILMKTQVSDFKRHLKDDACANGDIAAIKNSTDYTKELMNEHINNFKDHLEEDAVFHQNIKDEIRVIQDTQSRVKYMIVGAVSVVTFMGYAFKWGANFLIK